MSQKELVIWVEGVEDKMFFERIIAIKPPVGFSSYNIVEYACSPKDAIKKFLHSIERDRFKEYVFTGDKDDKPCITKAKEHLTSKHNRLKSEKIIVVVREIESWYMAGLTDGDSKALGLPVLRNTDDLTKEAFQNMIPSNESELYIRLQILEKFKYQEAKRRNASFKYFAKKYLE